MIKMVVRINEVSGGLVTAFRIKRLFSAPLVTEEVISTGFERERGNRFKTGFVFESVVRIMSNDKGKCLESAVSSSCCNPLGTSLHA